MRYVRSQSSRSTRTARPLSSRTSRAAVWSRGSPPRPARCGSLPGGGHQCPVDVEEHRLDMKPHDRHATAPGAAPSARHGGPRRPQHCVRRWNGRAGSLGCLDGPDGSGRRSDAPGRAGWWERCPPVVQAGRVRQPRRVRRLIGTLEAGMQGRRSDRPTPEQWRSAVDMLLEVQRTLAGSIDSGVVEDHDHHVLGLPSGLQGAVPGGARIEAALHAVMAARHLVQQAVHGTELSGMPVLDRAQRCLAISGGYVATTWTTGAFRTS